LAVGAVGLQPLIADLLAVFDSLGTVLDTLVASDPDRFDALPVGAAGGFDARRSVVVANAKLDLRLSALGLDLLGLGPLLAGILTVFAVLLALGPRGIAVAGGGYRGRRRNACQKGGDEKFTHGIGLSTFAAIPAPRHMKNG
jgi:hypothetical protein